MTAEPKENKPLKPKRRRKLDDIKVEVVHGEEMSPEQVDTVARILFEWWRRDFEKNGSNVMRGS